MNEGDIQSDPTGFLLTDSVRRVENQWLARTEAGALMRRAAGHLAALSVDLLRQMPGQPRVVAMIGPGNNGADALMCLDMLRAQGYDGYAALLSDVATTEERRKLLERWRQTDGATLSLSELIGPSPPLALREHPWLLIDGLFGLGLSRPLTGVAAQAARRSWRHNGPVIAVDIPSGLNGDTGNVVGGHDNVAVKASHTVTFIAAKPGLFTASGRDYSGHIRIHDLGVQCDTCDGQHLNERWVEQQLRVRSASGHKGSFGTVAIVGGAAGMPGAALLAAHGARVVGAGKVATISPDRATFDPAHPQLMAWQADSDEQLTNRLASTSAAAIGCGLGQSQRARRQLQVALASSCPLVLDADALNLLGDSAHRAALKDALKARIGNPLAGATVITPHPLEAARLLQQTAADVQHNRIASAAALASQTGAVTVLKGSGTIIARPDGAWGLISAGGPALATGGTGDVLAGLVTGLLAQGYSGWQAAGIAAWAHARAADRWTDQHPRAIGLDLNDLLQQIGVVLNGLGGSRQPAP